MYKEKKRERRIRDKMRMKAKARMVAKTSWGWADPNRVIKTADYLAACSCTICGNPRRWFGTRSLQEQRNALNCKWS